MVKVLITGEQGKIGLVFLAYISERGKEIHAETMSLRTDESIKRCYPQAVDDK